MENNKIYRDLQIHLDKYPIGFPAVESGVEINILKHFFDPMEARVALALGLTNSSVKRIAGRLKRKQELYMPEDELAGILHCMFMSGTIRRSDRSPYGYSNAMLVVGMFEFQVDNLTREFIEDLHQYFDEGFKDEFFRTTLPQLRTSPHMKAIVPEHKIDTYDNMIEIVEKFKGPIFVADCVCKQGEALIGKPCLRVDDIEVCLILGETPYEDRGQARKISKAECLEILDRAERSGLVLQPGNSKDPMFICCCCGCCCGVLTSAKKFDKPAELFATNYYAEIDYDTCTGCGICIDRCQMDAIVRTGKKEVQLLEDRCIGCGLCVTTCKKGAVALKRKGKKTVPPKNIELLYMTILMQRAGKKKMMLNLLRLMLGMQL